MSSRPPSSPRSAGRTSTSPSMREGELARRDLRLREPSPRRPTTPPSPGTTSPLVTAMPELEARHRDGSDLVPVPHDPAPIPLADTPRAPTPKASPPRGRATSPVQRRATPTRGPAKGGAAGQPEMAPLLGRPLRPATSHAKPVVGTEKAIRPSTAEVVCSRHAHASDVVAALRSMWTQMELAHRPVSEHVAEAAAAEVALTTAFTSERAAATYSSLVRRRVSRGNAAPPRPDAAPAASTVSTTLAASLRGAPTFRDVRAALERLLHLHRADTDDLLRRVTAAEAEAASAKEARREAERRNAFLSAQLRGSEGASMAAVAPSSAKVRTKHSASRRDTAHTPLGAAGLSPGVAPAPVSPQRPPSTPSSDVAHLSVTALQRPVSPGGDAGLPATAVDYDELRRRAAALELQVAHFEVRAKEHAVDAAELAALRPKVVALEHGARDLMSRVAAAETEAAETRAAATAEREAHHARLVGAHADLAAAHSEVTKAQTAAAIAHRRAADTRTQASFFSQWRHSAECTLHQRRSVTAAQQLQTAMRATEHAGEALRQAKGNFGAEEDRLLRRIAASEKAAAEANERAAAAERKLAVAAAARDALTTQLQRVSALGGSTAGMAGEETPPAAVSPRHNAAGAEGTVAEDGALHLAPPTNRRALEEKQSRQHPYAASLETYNVLHNVLKTTRNRLKLKGVDMSPMVLASGAASGIEHLVLKWIRDTAGRFWAAFSLEEDLGKLKYRTLCLIMRLRLKLALIERRLTTPTDAMERQIVQAKRKRYLDLLPQAGALRAKISAARAMALATGGVETQSGREMCLSLERELRAFQKVVDIADADQFRLNVKLVRHRMSLAAAPAGLETPSLGSTARTVSRHSVGRHRATFVVPGDRRRSPSASDDGTSPNRHSVSERAMAREIESDLQMGVGSREVQDLLRRRRSTCSSTVKAEAMRQRTETTLEQSRRLLDDITVPSRSGSVSSKRGSHASLSRKPSMAASALSVSSFGTGRGFEDSAASGVALASNTTPVLPMMSGGSRARPQGLPQGSMVVAGPPSGQVLPPTSAQTVQDQERAKLRRRTRSHSGFGPRGGSFVGSGVSQGGQVVLQEETLRLPSPLGRPASRESIGSLGSAAEDTPDWRDTQDAFRTVMSGGGGVPFDDGRAASPLLQAEERAARRRMLDGTLRPEDTHPKRAPYSRETRRRELRQLPVSGTMARPIVAKHSLTRLGQHTSAVIPFRSSARAASR